MGVTPVSFTHFCTESGTAGAVLREKVQFYVTTPGSVVAFTPTG